MRTPTRYLLDQLAAAINAGDAPATFDAAQDLAELLATELGETRALEAAVALTRALALDAGHVVTVPPRIVVTLIPGLARCA